MVRDDSRWSQAASSGPSPARVSSASTEREKAMVESWVIVVTYWLEVSPEEQTRRLESRINDPR
jgi:polyphosphate kinase 2 (PPK2 family)